MLIAVKRDKYSMELAWMMNEWLLFQTTRSIEIISTKNTSQYNYTDLSSSKHYSKSVIQ